MKKTWVVITSIYPPRDLIKEYFDLGWNVVVVADTKTPEEDWLKFVKQGLHYLSPARQDELFPEFSRKMGFKTYARKNLGYLFAVSQGADSIFDTDDDTFIRNDAKELIANTSLCEQVSVSNIEYFNPYSFFEPQSGLWPRGYPLRRVATDRFAMNPNAVINKEAKVPFDILQTLVNLEPDIDSIYRMTLGDHVQDFGVSNRIVQIERPTVSPANTQSTLWVNKAKFQYLYIPRWVTFRFSDILKMYVAQQNLVLAYAGFWTEQFRNPHDYMVDFESEVQCFLNTEKVVTWLRENPTSTLEEAYSGLFELEVCNEEEVELASMFEESMLRLVNG